MVYVAMMFKLFRKVLCVFIIFGIIFVPIVTAFGGETHRTLTETAFNSIDISQLFRDDEQDELMEHLFKSCNTPDYEETDKNIFYGHFYDFNYECSDLTKHSAMSMMCCHFRNAKNLWADDEKFLAIDELGKSIHYMQDMCCIVHLLGRFDLNNLHLLVHKQYENAMDAVAISYFYKIVQSKDKFDYRYNDGMSVVGIANAYSLQVSSKYNKDILSIFCSTLSTFISDMIGISDKSEIRIKAKKAIPFEDFEIAYKATCELIYLFFKEVGIEL